MAYNTWTVVAFEVPTAAKWNQLGSNDAGFRDGTNFSDNIVKVNHIDWADVFAREGFMVNGKISRTVASNNITVAIKTASGGDPSVSDPVYVRIGDTVYTITAALSVTKNAGTNWCNAGSSELATNEVDYFTYLGVTGGSVFIGFSRIPSGRLYSDFSSTSTAEKYLAISASPSASDAVVNIGRFNAILSASASYNWSVPGTSIIIQRPVYETRLLTYTPLGGGSGSLTYTSVTYNTKQYQIVDNTVRFYLQASGTTGGVTNTTLTLTLPFTVSATIGSNVATAGFTGDTAVAAGLSFFGASGTVINVRKYDASNWGLGASRQVSASGIYPI